MAMPPDADTRKIGPAGVPNRIVPSPLHVAPRGSAAAVILWTVPLPISMVLILSCEKKPMEWLSGDQKGKEASSVRASGCADADPRGRNHKRARPSLGATNARLKPSGDIAREDGSEVGGVVTSSCILGEMAAGRTKNTSATAKAPAKSKAAAHANRPRELDLVIATCSSRGLFSTSWMVMRASPIACRRARGSFVRHRRSNSRKRVGVFAGSVLQSGSLVITK